MVMAGLSSVRLLVCGTEEEILLRWGLRTTASTLETNEPWSGARLACFGLFGLFFSVPENISIYLFSTMSYFFCLLERGFRVFKV